MLSKLKKISMSEAKHILDMYYKQTSSQKPIKASYLVCRALENTEFQNVMVVTEENLKKLDGNIIYYYIYSILPDDCTVPIVTVNYSNPIPDDNTAVVPIKEKQLLMTDFINVVKVFTHEFIFLFIFGIASSDITFISVDSEEIIAFFISR